MGKVFNMVGGGGKAKDLAQYQQPTLQIDMINRVATATGLEQTITGQLEYVFELDGVEKERNTTGVWNFGSELLVEGHTYEFVCRIDGIGLAKGVPSWVLKEYVIPRCVVTGLGSQSPSDVTFSVDADFDWNFEHVTKDGREFIKFPKMYRKVTSSSDGQITGYILSPIKAENDYQIYPCFLKEDGVTEMDYVLMAVNCESGSVTIGQGRANAMALGTGYQLMDWMIFKLWQDLLICKMKTIDTNSGAGIETDQLGIVWSPRGIAQYPWIDGIASPASGNNWVFSYKPSAYVDSPSASTTGYQQVNYARPTSNGCISVLGYDSNHPFVNYPKTASGSTYTTYYCDGYYYGSGSHPVRSYVGGETDSTGAFRCDTDKNWTGTYEVRFCYRPINE